MVTTEAQTEPTAREKLLAAWRRERDDLYIALRAAGEAQLADKALHCGRLAWRYHCASCGKDTDLPISCDIRLCPRCAVRRSARFIRKHSAHLDLVQNPKLLTLTFKSPPYLSSEEVSRETAAFAKLRRTKLWKGKVAGGLSGLEFTYGVNGWHPHFHALLDSQFLPIKELETHWHRITQDSFVVYLQAARREDAVYEVAKYVAKGSAFYSNPETVSQYLRSTLHRRFFATFGYFAEKCPAPTPGTRPSAAQVLADLVNPPGPTVPIPRGCDHCEGTQMTFVGQVETEPITRPAYQDLIPF